MSLKESGRHLVFIGGTSEPGGLHVHTADVAIACAATGVETTIVCTSLDHFSGLLEDCDVRLVVANEHGLKTDWAQETTRLLRELGGTAAILCNGHFAAIPISDMMRVRRACRQLYTIEHRPNETPPASRMKRYGFGAGMSLLVHRCLAVSEEIAQQALQDYRLWPGKARVCLNWVDPAFRPLSASRRRCARRKIGIDPDTLIIGFHGRIAPEKRLHILLLGYAKLTPEERAGTRLVVVGDGHKRGDLEALAAVLGLSDNIVFTGWSTDPSELVGIFDISVLPSLVEGFPLSLMEAMASASFCIAHPMPSSRHLLGKDGSRGMLARLDEAADMAVALAGAVRMTDGERCSVAERAAGWIARNHSRDHLLPDVLAALDVVGTCVEGSRLKRRNLVFFKP